MFPVNSGTPSAPQVSTAPSPTAPPTTFIRPNFAVVPSNAGGGSGRVLVRQHQHHLQRGHQHSIPSSRQPPRMYFESAPTFYDQTMLHPLQATEERTARITKEGDMDGGDGGALYSRDAKKRIYTATGVVCSALAVMLLLLTGFVIRRRLKSSRDISGGRASSSSAADYHDGGDSCRVSTINISDPADPWTTNEKLKQAFPGMIRSHVWFDSLER